MYSPREPVELHGIVVVFIPGSTMFDCCVDSFMGSVRLLSAIPSVLEGARAPGGDDVAQQGIHGRMRRTGSLLSVKREEVDDFPF